MQIPIWSLVVALILVSLALWVNETLCRDEMVKKVVRVVIVVMFVLWVVGLVTGVGPTISFR